MELYQHESGLLLRKGSTDHKTLVEIKREYTWMPVKDKKVLDIGGCFGGYSRYALENGAKEVLCIEPEPRNYETTCMNLEKFPNAKIINKACVHEGDEEIPFYLTTSGKSFGNFSTYKYRGRNEIKVKTIKFNDVLEQFKPDVIKMDCEGREFDLLTKPLPECVKYFTMELHFTSPSTVKPSWFERARQLIKIFDDWETVKEPKISSTLWQTIGAWKR